MIPDENYLEYYTRDEREHRETYRKSKIFLYWNIAFFIFSFLFFRSLLLTHPNIPISSIQIMVIQGSALFLTFSCAFYAHELRSINNMQRDNFDSVLNLQIKNIELHKDVEEISDIIDYIRSNLRESYQKFRYRLGFLMLAFYWMKSLALVSFFGFIFAMIVGLISFIVLESPFIQLTTSIALSFLATGFTNIPFALFIVLRKYGE